MSGPARPRCLSLALLPFVAPSEHQRRAYLGMIDADLLARVDERRTELGQTRRMYIERALQAALDGPPGMDPLPTRYRKAPDPMVKQATHGSPSPSLQRFRGK